MVLAKDIKAADDHPRIVRYADLKPCFDAFIDTRTPGSDKKENFTIIGPGVSENPNQYVHIAEPHGFNIGGARQPPGCLNSQHSHDTAEVFFVHKGTWSFNLGEDGKDARITLNPGDLISIPTKVFRGFENIGDDMGYLWAVLGGDNPGKVLWAPDVFELAKNYGLVLLENGVLIDTAKGETVPEGAKVMPVTSQAQVDALHRFDDQRLKSCCVLERETEIKDKTPLIGPDGSLSWPHDFTVDRYKLNSGERSEAHKKSVADVVFVHKGALTVALTDETWTLYPGDTATIPKDITRQFVNTSDAEVDFIRVLGH